MRFNFYVSTTWKSPINFEKLVYRNNDGTDLGETIAKESPIIMVKWLGIN